MTVLGFLHCSAILDNPLPVPAVAVQNLMVDQLEAEHGDEATGELVASVRVTRSRNPPFGRRLLKLLSQTSALSETGFLVILRD